MDLQLQDKVVLISGGAKGIGREVVNLFLEEGASVAVADLHPTNDDDRILWLAGDLTDSNVCQQAVQATVEKFGRLDILVNNAGVNDTVGVDAGADNFMQSLQRNLVHYYSLLHFALEHLKESQGNVVNVSSKVAQTGQGGTSGYAAAKGGVNALTREWAVDLAPFGIRSNTVCPAEVWTQMYADWLKSVADPEAEQAKIEKSIPLGQRFTTPEELAATVVFLASPRSSHTTGQILFVDGGYTHLDRRCTL